MKNLRDNIKTKADEVGPLDELTARQSEQFIFFEESIQLETDPVKQLNLPKSRNGNQ